MREAISDVMARQPITVPKTATLAEAARLMREADIGDVLVMDGDRLCGVITDRDIVIRAVALDHDMSETTVDEIASHNLVSISPRDPLADAEHLIREHAVRRLPVVDGGQLVGVVSLGDLALERDDESVLADVSAAEPNH
jgi:CBS domain-containing protein